MNSNSSAEEWLASSGTRTLRVEMPSRFLPDAAYESYDDFEFPPTARPGREVFTKSLSVFLLITFMASGGWKLIPLILRWYDLTPYAFRKGPR
jgi:hypothetical protein